MACPRVMTSDGPQLATHHAPTMLLISLFPRPPPPPPSSPLLLLLLLLHPSSSFLLLERETLQRVIVLACILVLAP